MMKWRIKNILFSYEGNIIFEDFLRDYVKKHTNYETLDTKMHVFKIGIILLNSSRFMKSKLKDHLKEGSEVRFIRKLEMNYAGDKEYMEELLNMAKNDPTFGFDVIIVKKIKILLFGKPYLGELKGQFMKVVFIC